MQRLLFPFNWKSGSSISVWVMPILAIIFLVLGINYLNEPTSHLTSRRFCLNSLGSNCTYFHRDESLICFFVAFCCLIVTAEIGRLSSQLKGATGVISKLLMALNVVRYISYSAKRFFFDVAVIMTLAVLTSTGASVIDGSQKLHTWERWELRLLVPIVLILLALEVVSNRQEIMKRLHTLLLELFMLIVISMIVFGHFWANWSWENIAIAAGIVAAINALGRWLVPAASLSNTDKTLNRNGEDTS
jgi:hypothetical protein